MKKLMIRSALLLTCSMFAPGLAATSHAADFVLKSAEVGEGKMMSSQQVFQGFGCTGKNTSPSLSWSGAPKGAKSFVVTVYDPDAPTGSGWWHWSVYNIPASVNALPAGAKLGEGPLAKAAAVRNDYGTKAFGGACPPPGEVHRYIFTVYALDVPKLDIPDGASPALLGFMTRSHAIDSAHFTALYMR